MKYLLFFLINAIAWGSYASDSYQPGIFLTNSNGKYDFIVSGGISSRGVLVVADECEGSKCYKKVESSYMFNKGEDLNASDEINLNKVYRYEVSGIKIKNSITIAYYFPNEKTLSKTSLIKDRGGDIIKVDGSVSKGFVCKSEEGVHLYTLSKNRNVNNHMYYSLGYSVKPDCDRFMHE
ncbi:hypothetical protein [Aeromonas sp. SER]|uniref:hypothetical protein n=1 Tax=Aeromonas sp. SER TaxID=3135721 RepID=UPI0031641AB7